MSSNSLLDEFTDYLTIDRHALDDAIQKQPSLYFAVSDALAAELSVRDGLKKKVDEVYADVTLQMRQESVRTGIKITEDQVKQTALLCPDYQQTHEEYLQQKLLCDRLLALKEAFSTRGYMLRDLVSLWVAGYFSTTPVKVSEQQQEQVRYETARHAIAARRKLIPKEV